MKAAPLTLYHADALDLLAQTPDGRYACCFLDPPYNTGNERSKVPAYTRSEYMKTRNWENFYAENGWDTIPDYEAWCATWLEALRPKMAPRGSVFICGTFHGIPDVSYALRATGWRVIQWIAWCIKNSMPHLAGRQMANANQTIIWARPFDGPAHFYDYAAAKRHNAGQNLRDFWTVEQGPPAWVKRRAGLRFHRGRMAISDAWDVPNDATEATRLPFLKERTGRKPVPLVRRALDIATPKDAGAVVADLFGGSGTTGAAARQLGLACDLADRDAGAISVIERRLGVTALSLQPSALSPGTGRAAWGRRVALQDAVRALLRDPGEMTAQALVRLATGQTEQEPALLAG